MKTLKEALFSRNTLKKAGILELDELINHERPYIIYGVSRDSRGIEHIELFIYEDNYYFDAVHNIAKKSYYGYPSNPVSNPDALTIEHRATSGYPIILTIMERNFKWYDQYITNKRTKIIRSPKNQKDILKIAEKLCEIGYNFDEEYFNSLFDGIPYDEYINKK